MTSHVGRLYAASASIVVFFGTWLAVATHPWAQQASDPRLAVLAAREQRLRVESAVVQTLVRDRWATYRGDLARLRSQAGTGPATAPPVRVVTLPPVTTTRTS